MAGMTPWPLWSANFTWQKSSFTRKPNGSPLGFCAVGLCRSGLLSKKIRSALALASFSLLLWMRRWIGFCGSGLVGSMPRFVVMFVENSYSAFSDGLYLAIRATVKFGR